MFRHFIEDMTRDSYKDVQPAESHTAGVRTARQEIEVAWRRTSEIIQLFSTFSKYATFTTEKIDYLTT